MNAAPTGDPPTTILRRWFQAQGWTPQPFQEEVWIRSLAGESGLLHAPTGSGKTLAVWGGALLQGLAEAQGDPLPLRGPRWIWITPLRALARDLVQQLQEPLSGVGLLGEVALRTGDTSAADRNRQRKRPPWGLVTTPESLSVMLSSADSQRLLSGVMGVAVDEWHELLGTKRGVQTELALARLRHWNPGLRVWGISATLPHLEEALDVLLGGGPQRKDPQRGVVHGPPPGAPRVESLLPADAGRFPWAGHLGISLLPQVLDRIHTARVSLLFTNTRSQAELWYSALVRALPDWESSGLLALHHGSLDREERERVEEGLRTETLRCVVCTSTLDLGVDFPAVDQVFQLGSPKGLGRMIQRAGRSGHSPGGEGRLVCVPTHALELVEFAAARVALEEGRVEPRPPLRAPLDVLAQHLVTVALGGGFREEELRREVTSTWAYAGLSDAEWAWTLDFVCRGGSALQAYPRFRKVEVDSEGIHRVTDRRIGLQHRMAIGTLASDPQMQVRFLKGKALGTVEESFLARLRPGDTFRFGGRLLELVRIREMTAWVRRAERGMKGVPRWKGGRLPLSTELADAVLTLLGEGGQAPEWAPIQPLLQIQSRWSRIPRWGTLLVERTASREGAHLFLYPFLGRGVHEGLAALLALRWSREAPRSIQYSVNDYGIELLSPDPLVPARGWSALLTEDGLVEDLLEAMNSAELAQRQFRDIARVAGLVFPGYPGKGKSSRQIQASAGLLWEVLDRYDPDHLLLAQARREVLERELHLERIQAGLRRLSAWTVEEVDVPRFTPLAFPLWAERVQAQVSSERWADRVERMVRSLEAEADRGR